RSAAVRTLTPRNIRNKTSKKGRPEKASASFFLSFFVCHPPVQNLDQIQNSPDIFHHIISACLQIGLLCLFVCRFPCFRGQRLVFFLCQSHHRASLQDSYGYHACILSFQNVGNGVSHFHDSGYVLQFQFFHIPENHVRIRSALFVCG